MKKEEKNLNNNINLKRRISSKYIFNLFKKSMQKHGLAIALKSSLKYIFIFILFLLLLPLFAFADFWTNQPSHQTLYADTITSKTGVSPVTIADGQGLIVTTGSVGIGTTAPAQKLEINNGALGFIDSTETYRYTISPGAGILRFASSGGAPVTYFDLEPAPQKIAVYVNSLNFRQASTISTVSGDLTINPAVNTIFSTGNVGIGTSSPTAKLHIVGGSGRAIDIETAGQRLSFTTDLSYIADDGANFLFNFGRPNLLFQAAGINKLVLTSTGNLQFLQPSTISTTAGNLNLMPSGNVGIGTTSPSAKLEVDSDSGNAFLVQRTTGGGDIFYIQQGPPNVISMWPDASGNVGIGTTNPGAKQTVLGGDVYVASSGNGIILKDVTNGNCHRLVVSSGALSLSGAIACPAS